MGESVEIPLQSGLINEGVRSRRADPTVYPKGLRVVQDGEHSPLSVYRRSLSFPCHR
jgi:hypothetical protein